MEKNKKNKVKKIYERRKKVISLSFNPYEKTILEAQMQKEGWTNVGGFIKDKIFKNCDVKSEYKKEISKADEVILQKALVNIFEELNGQLNYVNFRCTFELEELKKQNAMIDSKTISKWVSLMANWTNEILKVSNDVMDDLTVIMKRMDIVVERKEMDYLRSIPQDVLDEMLANWNGNTSLPEYQEAARRILERKKNEKNQKD